MIDKDDSGTLDKAEVVDAVKNDKKVIKFLCNCGNQNLQYLLVPARLEQALAVLDTDRDRRRGNQRPVASSKGGAASCRPLHDARRGSVSGTRCCHA